MRKHLEVFSCQNEEVLELRRAHTATIYLYVKLTWFPHSKESRRSVLMSIGASKKKIILASICPIWLSIWTFQQAWFPPQLNTYRRQYALYDYMYVKTYLRCFLGLRKGDFDWGKPRHFVEGKRTWWYTTQTILESIGSH